jgi:hypothetical protein
MFMKFLLDRPNSKEVQPGVNVINLFSSSLMVNGNKLECFCLTIFFIVRWIVYWSYTTNQIVIFEINVETLRAGVTVVIFYQ